MTNRICKLLPLLLCLLLALPFALAETAPETAWKPGDADVVLYEDANARITWQGLAVSEELEGLIYPLLTFENHYPGAAADIEQGGDGSIAIQIDAVYLNGHQISTYYEHAYLVSPDEALTLNGDNTSLFFSLHNLPAVYGETTIHSFGMSFCVTDCFDPLSSKQYAELAVEIDAMSLLAQDPFFTDNPITVAAAPAFDPAQPEEYTDKLLYEDEHVLVAWNGLVNADTYSNSISPSIYIRNKSQTDEMLFEALDFVFTSHPFGSVIINAKVSNDLFLAPGTDVLSNAEYAYVFDVSELLSVHAMDDISGFSMRFLISNDETGLWVKDQTRTVAFSCDPWALMSGDAAFLRQYPDPSHIARAPLYQALSMCYDDELLMIRSGDLTSLPDPQLAFRPIMYLTNKSHTQTFTVSPYACYVNDHRMDLSNNHQITLGPGESYLLYEQNEWYVHADTLLDVYGEADVESFSIVFTLQDEKDEKIGHSRMARARVKSSLFDVMSDVPAFAVRYPDPASAAAFDPASLPLIFDSEYIEIRWDGSVTHSSYGYIQPAFYVRSKSELTTYKLLPAFMDINGISVRSNPPLSFTLESGCDARINATYYCTIPDSQLQQNGITELNTFHLGFYVYDDLVGELVIPLAEFTADVHLVP